jgi:hypothetical protein
MREGDSGANNEEDGIDSESWICNCFYRAGSSDLTVSYGSWTFHGEGQGGVRTMDEWDGGDQ